MAKQEVKFIPVIDFASQIGVLAHNTDSDAYADVLAEARELAEECEYPGDLFAALRAMARPDGVMYPWSKAWLNNVSRLRRDLQVYHDLKE